MLLSPKPEVADFKLDMFEIEITNHKLSRTHKLEYKVEALPPTQTTFGEFIEANKEDIEDNAETLVPAYNLLALQISQLVRGERTYAYLVIDSQVFVFTAHTQDADKKFLAEVKRNGLYAPDIVFDVRVVPNYVRRVRLKDSLYGVSLDMEIDTTIGLPTDNPREKLVITYLGMVTGEGFALGRRIPDYMKYNPGAPFIQELNERVARIKDLSGM